MTTKRWDSDERGQGEASAASFTNALRRLADEMSGERWIVEDPQVHLLPHLQEAVVREGSPWRLISAESSADGRYVIDVQWVGDWPSAYDLRTSVFALVGAIAESSTHVRQLSDREFEIPTGMLEGDSGWRAHGHVLLLRIACE